MSNTHTTHTAQHTLHNASNDEEFALAKGHIDGHYSHQLYHALQQHIVVIWGEMTEEEVEDLRPRGGGGGGGGGKERICDSSVVMGGAVMQKMVLWRVGMANM